MIIPGGMPKQINNAVKLSRQKQYIEDIELCIKNNIDYFGKSYIDLDIVQKSFIKSVNYMIDLKNLVFESFYEEFVLNGNWTRKRFYEAISTEDGLFELESKINSQIKMKEDKLKNINRKNKK